MTADELRFSQGLIDEMVAHCEAERPNEGCGLIACRAGEVVKVLRMTNVSASPMRYSLDPREQFTAYSMLDREGLDLGGVFHSHTHTAAYPSPTDIGLASEDVPYLIVSLSEPEPDIRAFRIIKDSWRDPNGRVEEVPVVVVR